MAEKFELAAQHRNTVGSGIKALRRSGKVPGVVYGHNIASSSIQLDTRDLGNVLRKVGRNSLITLDIDGSQRMVLRREVQRDPVTRALLHIDFYEVSMTEKITASVRILIIGETVSPDLKSGAGVLLQERSSIEIECLPSDLFDTITIDVTKFKIGDVVRLKDLAIPSGVTVLESADEEIVRIQRFVEAKVEEGGAESAEVEVIEKGKKEEEEA
ncbi:MAG: 50S ribosomal protein L25 [Chloroflexi bacterium]|nr:50S ribosomal protein L25 [Chloroflexota bacterium]